MRTLSRAFPIVWVFIWIAGVFVMAVKAQNRANKARQSQFEHHSVKVLKTPSADPGAIQQEPSAPRSISPSSINRLQGPVHDRLSEGGAKLKSSSALSELLQEDRRNDWLARQLRDERNHMVWNNFTDLGARHDMLCDAQTERRAHRLVHQSFMVDDGITDN